MRKSYGEMIIPKNTILYHTSEEKFEYKNMNEKAMLFCVFHPSELNYRDEFVTFIKLKKDISLLFMIEGCKNCKILSSLLLFTNHLSFNLAKRNNNQLLSYVDELKKEDFSGWFSSIDDRAAVEVALINDLSIFEAIKTDELKPYWKRGHYSYITESIILKDWRLHKYIFSNIENPVYLNIHIKFKNIIEEYKKNEINSGHLREYAFQVLLDHAIITYHEGDFEKIEWKYVHYK